MILTNPNGTSYRFQVEDVVLVEFDEWAPTGVGYGRLYLRGCSATSVPLDKEQLAQVQEALDRL